MGIDYGSLSDVLKNPIRRRIILTLSGSTCISYVDLMKLVEVSNTGKFNYHLKSLGDLIQKDANGKYCLTEKGRMAAQLLQKFPEKEAEPKSLRMGGCNPYRLCRFCLPERLPCCDQPPFKRYV